MSATPILFAAGPNGVTLNVPDGVTVELIGASVDPLPPKSEAEQRALVAAALEKPEYGQPLSKLAAIKRRAAILVGDLSRPAPYDTVLPTIIENLVKAGIRPSRIAVFACPGGSGPLLGRAAIHRYGEEVCGDHEAVAWPLEGTPGLLYDTADLRIAVASMTALERFGAYLPDGTNVDFALSVELGTKATIDIESVRAFEWCSGEGSARLEPCKAFSAEVWITSGGGGAWEETLEEALLGLRAMREAVPLNMSSIAKEYMAKRDEKQSDASFGRLLSKALNESRKPGHNFVTARTAVLIFSGAEGIGSARFAQDVWALVEQAEEILAAGKALNLAQKPSAPYDPASTLADALSRYKNTVLFAPEFCAHPEGEDLAERIAAAPNVAKRLALCASERELWAALELLHGLAYTLAAQPLGWRAF